MDEDEKKRRQREADQRRAARLRAAKLGLEGPPLLRVVTKRAHAKTPEEKAARAEERKLATRARATAYAEANPEKVAAYKARYAEANKAKKAAQAREYRKTGIPQARKKERFATDVQLRTRIQIAEMIRSALIRYGGTKNARTLELLGCSIPDLRAYLESLFRPGMTWENYGTGGWEIDHRIPCAAWDLTDPAQQAACFHFTNLQPLWMVENRRKSRRVDPALLEGLPVRPSRVLLRPGPKPQGHRCSASPSPPSWPR